ncbi:hypothetical protein [Cryobacterium sp. Hh11]|nr:hypothetical protein [Cryobacterium sp. Hh11]
MPNQTTEKYIGKHVADRTWQANFADFGAIGNILPVTPTGRHS